MRGPNRRLRRILLAIVLVALIAFFATTYLKAMRYARYPLSEKPLIVECAGQYQISPELVAAVILCESSFRANAVSSAGAVGLMQLMPDTGEWISGKLGDTAYAEERLYEPETNVRYGCWLIRWLLDRYGGDVTTAMAAYHAGHGRVDGWLGDPELSPDGARLADIPYSSTSAYVARITEAIKQYEELYDFEA